MPCTLLVRLLESAQSISVDKRRGDIVHVRRPGIDLGVGLRTGFWGIIHVPDVSYERMRQLMYPEREARDVTTRPSFTVDIDALPTTTRDKLRGEAGSFSSEGYRIVDKAEIEERVQHRDGGTMRSRIEGQLLVRR